MRVIIGCEYSGKIRDEFAKRGHDAWSCDLLPTELPGNHLQCDILSILGEGWDLGIFHPPCTFLSKAANHVWNAPGREEQREEAVRFVKKLYAAPIKRICLENPLGFLSERRADGSLVFRKYDQIIHPYYFGEPHLKRTCLWLKNLPKLFWAKEDDLFAKQTLIERPAPMYIDKISGKKRYFTDGNRGGAQTI